MTARMVSPGGFTQENDLSFLPQGIAQIGAGFVGPFLQGPAFVPVTVTSQADFTARFGTTTPDFYTPYAVTEYLKNAAQAVCVRVLGLGGYDSSVNRSVILFVSGAGGKWPIALLHPTRNAIALALSSATGSSTNFTVALSGSDASATGSGLSAFPTAS